MEISTSMRHLDVIAVTLAGEKPTGNISGTTGTNTTQRYWDIPWTCTLATLMILFIILSIGGNIMVIIVVGRKKGMLTRTNMFLCNLAVADLLAGITVMPVSLITVISGRWIFSDFMCQLNGFLTGFLLTCSIHTLMYIAIHKYMSITRPLRKIITRRRVALMLLATWLWAGLAGYVRVHGLSKVIYKPHHTQCAPDSPSDLRTYMSVVFVAVTNYTVPLAVMFFCYIRIFQEIRSYAARLAECTNQGQEEIYGQQRRSSLTLCIILIVFLLCFSPYIAYCFYIAIIKDKSLIPENLNAVVYWFGYMNSAVNPVIYGLRISGFRHGYSDMVMRLHCRGNRLNGVVARRSRAGSMPVNGTDLRTLSKFRWLSETHIATPDISMDNLRDIHTVEALIKASKA